jgi:sterol O-acyltransferase
LEKQSKKHTVPKAQTAAVSKGLGSEIASLKRQNSRQRSIDLKNIHSDSSHDTDHLLLLSETIENGTPLAPGQMRSLKSLLEQEIELLTEALKGQSKSSNHYPGNLTIGNFCDFITLPTLVYELQYPRTERIDWAYVVEKTAATFGTIVVMIVISQHWIYPVVMSALRMEQEGMTVEQRLQEFPWVLSDLLFPFMMEYLLAFYVIWECVVSLIPVQILFFFSFFNPVSFFISFTHLS